MYCYRSLDIRVLFYRLNKSYHSLYFCSNYSTLAIQGFFRLALILRNNIYQWYALMPLFCNCIMQHNRYLRSFLKCIFPYSQLLFLWDKFSLYSSDRPWTGRVAKVGLELMAILLSQLPKWWGYRYVPPLPAPHFQCSDSFKAWDFSPVICNSTESLRDCYYIGSRDMSRKTDLGKCSLGYIL